MAFSLGDVMTRWFAAGARPPGGAGDSRPADELAAAARTLDTLATRIEGVFEAARELEDHVADVRRDVMAARGSRQQVETRFYAFVRDLLSVLDDFRSAPPGGPEEAFVPACEAVLDRHGIERLDDPVGRPFDASVHCCERSIPAAEAIGTVVESLAAGYAIRVGSRTLLVRPARVVVSGGPSGSRGTPGRGTAESTPDSTARGTA